MIEQLFAKELCPRLHIDITYDGAVCPDFVVDKWQQQLVIDLDPSYPLDLGFTEVGVEADLSFGGFVSRCVFPWDAIYVVADRDTGRGKVFEDNVPAALRAKFGLAGIDPKLTEIQDDEAAKTSSRRRRRRPKPKPKPLEAVPEVEDDIDEDAGEDEAGEAEDNGEADDNGEAETKSDEDASAKRRAAFRVIDGDG